MSGIRRHCIVCGEIASIESGEASLIRGDGDSIMLAHKKCAPYLNHLEAVKCSCCESLMNVVVDPFCDKKERLCSLCEEAKRHALVHERIEYMKQKSLASV